MQERSSRPLRRPNKTPQPLVRKIVHVRLKRRVGPVEIAGIVGLPASTVHAVLRRCGISRLSSLDRATGEPVGRYEHPHPGALLHADVKKLGQVPMAADTAWSVGSRAVGTALPPWTKPATPTAARRWAHAYVHTVVDDHSRVAYAEIHDDETAVTATGVLRRAVLWFAARGVVIERVLTDNGSCYRSKLWRQQCQDLDITHKRARPYRPQTNGRVERFPPHHDRRLGLPPALLSESSRRKAQPDWLHEYNHHRNHSAIGKVPPITRLTNPPGQYS
jgi:transposase InsO family protein